MKKIWITIFVLFFLFFSLKGVGAEANSYELFWPVVAGRVKGDSLYPFKLLKEKVRVFLIFDSGAKAEHFSFLSTKRLVEFEKLALVDKDFSHVPETLSAYLDAQEKSVFYLEKAAGEGQNVSKIRDGLRVTLEKQILLLETISAKVDKSHKNLVQEVISKVFFP